VGKNSQEEQGRQRDVRVVFPRVGFIRGKDLQKNKECWEKRKKASSRIAEDSEFKDPMPSLWVIVVLQDYSRREGTQGGTGGWTRGESSEEKPEVMQLPVSPQIRNMA